MPTPSIQTLTTDAQQVLNLDSISAVRSVVAVALANANTGTPLNPNLTTQQLWDQFYQVVTRPKSDIESIIANQLMKFLYSPPAPGGAGADKQVIFNDGGVLAGDADFLWNKTTNLLTVTGAATISGELTANSNVRVGASPAFYGGKIATNGSIAIAQGNYLKLWDSTGNGVAGINAGAADTLTFSLTNVFTTAMTLNSTGLGVGGSPTRKLSIVGSGNTYANINSGDNTSLVGVLFGGTSAPSNGQIIYNNTDNSMGLHTAGAVKLTIDSSGNVGIGVTSPRSKADVYGTLTVGSNTAPNFDFKRDVAISGVDSGIGSLNYGARYDATNYGVGALITGQSAGAWTSTSTPGYISFRTTPSSATTPVEGMRLDASGRLLVGPTSANASGGVLQLSSGITFPATQVASSDANTLDDYEEGTWTIVVNNQLGNSATIASQIARYVKIGRRVFVFGDFTLSAKGAAAAGNLVYLGNLPFVPNSTLFEGSVVHKYDNVNLTTNGQINIISAAGGNNVCFFPISSATTGTSNLTFGQITDTTRLVFNFSYDV